MAEEESLPQWKRELILRRRAAGKQLSGECGYGHSEALGSTAGHQPSDGSSSPSTTACAAGSLANAVLNSGSSTFLPCNTCSGRTIKMVQERAWAENKQISVDMVSGNEKNDSDSSSSEELQYGPGIVSKLKNRYLSLTLREQNVRARPSILPMRKATSLENLLDGDGEDEQIEEKNRMFETRTKNGNTTNNVPYRYRNSSRGSVMKRARSVEAISRTVEPNGECHPKRESMHEDVFIIKEGNDKPHRKTNVDNTTESKVITNNVINPRMNRPKRIAPVLSEKEKPPADFVKQTKKIFESHPKSRTREPESTGEVAAKVASFRDLIIQTKVSSKSKPPVKTKPEIARKLRPDLTNLLSETKSVVSEPKIITSPDVAPLQSPIPDISSDSENRKTTLSETPDLILHSSPAHKPLITTTNDFINAEINFSNSATQPLKLEINGLNPQYGVINTPVLIAKAVEANQKHTAKVEPAQKPTIIEPVQNTTKTEPAQKVTKTEQPKKQPPVLIAKSDSNQKPAVKQIAKQKAPSPPINPPTSVLIAKTTEAVRGKPPPPPTQTAVPLSPREIEKNFINKELHQQQGGKPPVAESGVVPVKKRTAGRAKQQEAPNCVVFKFTDRVDVPDYIVNDGALRTTKIELPKAGEGGITILPGAAISDEFADYEEELRSLEGPPSPCDVDFINGNILIEGRSSLIQKTKRPKMRIQFVEAVPQIFEYPSEASMLLDDAQSEPSQSAPMGSCNVGKIVPPLSGSTLANYTPKAAYTDDFQLGVTKTPAPVAIIPETKQTEPEPEMDEPVLFSAGSTTDILF